MIQFLNALPLIVELVQAGIVLGKDIEAWIRSRQNLTDVQKQALIDEMWVRLKARDEQVQALPEYVEG